MESKSKQAVVLLSGGMDSCVTLAMARERHGVGKVAVVHAGYGQRTQAREQRAFEEIADFYGIRERLVVQLDHFRVIGGSGLFYRENGMGEGGQPTQPPGGERSVSLVPFHKAPFLSVSVR